MLFRRFSLKTSPSAFPDSRSTDLSTPVSFNLTVNTDSVSISPGVTAIKSNLILLLFKTVESILLPSDISIVPPDSVTANSPVSGLGLLSGHSVPSTSSLEAEKSNPVCFSVPMIILSNPTSSEVKSGLIYIEYSTSAVGATNTGLISALDVFWHTTASSRGLTGPAVAP